MTFVYRKHYKKFYIIFFLIFLNNCQLQESNKSHGINFLENREKTLKVGQTNKNDVIKLIGSAHSTSLSDENIWIYFERTTAKGKLIKLGQNVLKKNNVLELKFDKYGILSSKKFYNKESMNKVKYSERETENEVEILGIKRARDRAETADLRIFLTEEKPLKEFIIKQELDIEIASKGDLSGVGVSGLTGYGIPELIDLVSEKLTKMALGAGIATNERHRRAMIISVGALKNCKKELKRDVVRSEIAAEELRSSIMALESMVGSVGVEDLLDEIFANFCLGK